MNVPADGEHVREVYARFGLAIYRAQVLEHGLVNALTLLDLIPSRRHLARSREDWGAEVDGFMDRNFEDTMGKLMRSLRSVTRVPTNVDGLLKEALQKRNWLAHSFFRERATEFMSYKGREQMLREVDESGELFGRADQVLEAIVKPMRLKAGITDEMLEFETNRALSEARGG